MYQQQIWLDTGNIVIKSHLAGDNLIIDTVINSPIYYKAMDFYKSYSDILKAKDTIKINNFLLNKYEEHLNNLFSYAIGQNFVLRNQNSKLNLINFKSLFKQQGHKFSWFILYPNVVDRVNNILSKDKLNISDFTFFNNQNQKSKLNLVGADYYILDFWFLACAPCIRDHKDVKPTLKKLKNKNIKIIGISIDHTDKYKEWRTYLIKNNYSWQNYMQDSKNSLTEHLAIWNYPTYIILNNAGEIIASYNLFSDISKKYELDE
ncbi:MAG: redoxin domain-containing protein [Sporomusaceae bacterium]|nr:redoxin domain-containing protein [Sporomusaceae bacterium]